jgi:hypothetical protein
MWTAWKEWRLPAGTTGEGEPDARQRIGQSPANHRPTRCKYSDHAQAHSRGAGPGDARGACADVQVCDLFASDVDIKVPGQVLGLLLVQLWDTPKLIQEE